jgi:hypothetical protein
MNNVRYLVGSVLVVLGVIWILGCAEKSKAPPQPSAPQVRTDSDKFFEKMKPDEQERGVRR